jgi:RimJ/RimL family protein N-acetyltransferase
MIALASTLPHMRQIEIRCDPLNEPSAAVPRRLGFRQADSSPDAQGSHDMLWLLELPAPA